MKVKLKEKNKYLTMILLYLSSNREKRLQEQFCDKLYTDNFKKFKNLTFRPVYLMSISYIKVYNRATVTLILQD